MIAKIFVAFSEKLNFAEFKKVEDFFRKINDFLTIS